MARCANPNCDGPVYRRGLCMADDLRTPEIPEDAPLRVAQLQTTEEDLDAASYAWPASMRASLNEALARDPRGDTRE